MFHTASVDDLQRHYSCHFRPMPALPSEQHESAVGSQGREIHHEDTDADELRYVQYVINHLGRANKELVIDARLSVILKLCQEVDDILGTSLSLDHHEAELTVFYRNHTCNVKVRPIYGSYARAPGTSSFAWIPLSIGIQNSCQCTCCLLTSVGPSILSAEWEIRKLCFRSNLFHCDAHGCSHKCKRWADLKRHISTAHCSKAAANYPCSFPGCERSGENGFPRKDKMKSHFEKVHRGKGIRPRQPRPLAPK